MNRVFIITILILGLAATYSFAQMGGGMMGSQGGQGKMGGGMMGSQQEQMGQGGMMQMMRHGGYGMGHPFSSHWKETLTDKQKLQADRIHLALKKAISVPKAELNKLVVHDSPDTKAIHRKIDEILELKREIMRKKYEHMVEMRGILTPEQRVSFDMKLVEMAGHKKGHRHH